MHFLSQSEKGPRTAHVQLCDKMSVNEVTSERGNSLSSQPHSHRRHHHQNHRDVDRQSQTPATCYL